LTPPTLGDDGAMRTLTASHRAIVVTAVGLVLSLSLVGCSQDAASPTWVGCSLGQNHGNLVAHNGRVFLAQTQGAQPGSGTPLDLPDGLTVRPAHDGQLEIVDGWGIVLFTTGTRVIVYEDGNPDTPARNRDGEFVVCHIDRYTGDVP
jgi:hypothetical protein